MLSTLQQPVGVGLEEEVADDDIRAQVRSLLAGMHPRENLIERRGEQRYPYPYLIRLFPVAPDRLSPQGEGIVAVGKHISERGLGLYHPKPLPYRRMIVCFQSDSGRQVAFLIDLKWCRFTKQGWYESGGRFLRTVAPPSWAEG